MSEPTTTHSIIRTSPKGGQFVGMCDLCGEKGLMLADMGKECQNWGGATEDQALLSVLADQGNYADDGPVTIRSAVEAVLYEHPDIDPHDDEAWLVDKMLPFVEKVVARLRAEGERIESGKQLDKELRKALAGRDGFLSTYPANVMRFSENDPKTTAAISVEPVTIYPRSLPGDSET